MNTVQNAIPNELQLPTAAPLPVALPPPEAAKPEPLFYDINQAAAALNCCTKTIRRLIRRRKLTSCRVLRKILIPRKQVEDFIKATCDVPQFN